MSSLANKSISLDVDDLIQAIKWDFMAGYPVCIEGRTGIGKSEIVYRIGKDLSLKVVERRLSQMTEGDMLGLPAVNYENGTTKFNPPDWFKMACDEPCLLFFDEKDRGVHEVAQAVMQIADSFAMNGHVLHEKTRIIAAINGGSHATVHNYNVNAGDAAENDRWVSYSFDPSVNSWLKYATEQNLSPEIISFISENSSFLEFIGTMEPGVVYPSRRSWFRLDKKLKLCNLIELYREKHINSSTFIANCASYVGVPAAQSFAQHALKKVTISAKHVLAGEYINQWKSLSPTDILRILAELQAKKYFTLEVLQSNYDSVKDKSTSWAANIAKFVGPLDGELFTDFFEKVQASTNQEEDVVRFLEICDNHPVNVSVSENNGMVTQKDMTLTERALYIAAKQNSSSV